MKTQSALRCGVVSVACLIALMGSARSVAEEADAAAEIREAISEYLDAWNRGDAEALGAYYDEAYDWMNPLGMHLHGRDVVVAYQSASFKRQLPPNVQHSLSYDVNSIRLITDDVAVVDIKYTGTGMGPRPEQPVENMIFAVYVKKNGRWLRAAQRNFALLRPQK